MVLEIRMSNAEYSLRHKLAFSELVHAIRGPG